jgi:hypothetical protein
MKTNPVFRRLALAILLSTVGLAVAGAQQRAPYQPPDGVEMRQVVIWSEGSRLDGDLFYPRLGRHQEQLACAGRQVRRRGLHRPHLQHAHLGR